MDRNELKLNIGSLNSLEFNSNNTTIKGNKIIKKVVVKLNEIRLIADQEFEILEHANTVCGCDGYCGCDGGDDSCPGGDCPYGG